MSPVCATCDKETCEPATAAAWARSREVSERAPARPVDADPTAEPDAAHEAWWEEFKAANREIARLRDECRANAVNWRALTLAGRVACKSVVDIASLPTQEDYIETRVRIDVAKRASIRVAEHIAEALKGGV